MNTDQAAYILSDPPESAQTFDRSWRNYFMFKLGRRPRFRFGAKPETLNPDAAWDKLDAYLISKHHSFLTQKTLKDFGVAEDSVIREDTRMLNRTLVNAFIAEDHNASYWQNNYFLFQWMFAIFALLATVFAALTSTQTVAQATVASLSNSISPTIATTPSATLTVSATPGGLNSAVSAAQSQLQSNSGLASFFGLLTTVTAVIVTILVYIYNRDRPQRTWYEKRRNAESLRKHYFLYVTHMPPYDNQKHVFALQTMVARIQNSDSKKLEIPTDTPPRMPQHTPDESQALIKIYNELRIQEQMIYYKKRSREYDFNADVTLLLTLIIPLVVSLLAGLNIAKVDPVLATIVVVLPSLGGVFATFQRIYNWDPQQLLYSKSFGGLQAAKIIDTDGKQPDRILRELVEAVEGELTKEADQWGASLGENGEELSAEQIIDAFKKKVDATDEEVNQMRIRLGLK